MGTYTAENQSIANLTYITTGTGAPTITSSNVKSGNRAYRTTNDSPFGHFESPGVAEVEMGLWLYLTNNTIGAVCYLYYAGLGMGAANTFNQIYIRINPGAGTITVERPLDNSTDETLYTHSGVPAEFTSSGQYFHVGVRHKVGSSGYISFYVGGRLIFTYTGDTRPGNWNGTAQQLETTVTYLLGPGTVNGGSNGFDDANIDDLYFNEATSEANRVPPLLRFNEIFPDASGADAAWTPSAGSNWQNVDDVPHDSDTTYNSAISANLRDTFNFGSFTLPANHTIVKVLPNLYCKRLGSGELISLHAYDGSTYLDSADLTPPTGYDRPVFAEMPLQPDGSSWNESDLNLCQFGYRSRGTF
jgi:hypothetical protein